MLRFQVFENGKPAEHVNLDGAHLIGGDGIPMRSELQFVNGEIRCRKNVQGPAALALMWTVPGCGRSMVATTRLPERATPYNLHVELARGRAMRVLQKREEWGLFDFEGAEELNRQLEQAQTLLVRALQADDDAHGAALGDQSLGLSMQVGEEFALFHADIFLTRRQQGGQLPKRMFGIYTNPAERRREFATRLLSAADFVTVPMRWREIEPKEGQPDWEKVDDWIELLTRNKIPVKASPLLAFGERNTPDWLYIWENDYETLRQMIYEHIQRVLERYGRFIHYWDVVSGIHAENTFGLSFEQLMELTRVAANTVKQLSPRSTTIVDLIAPWSEYYARDVRTIPPLLYADMCMQSGISFDAIGLRFYFGVNQDDLRVRDMMQISSMLDRYANLGKPLHITAVQVPSSHSDDAAPSGSASTEGGGMWHQPWNEQTQALWIRDFLGIALSKPFVETVTWRTFADVANQYLPYGGMLTSDLKPKVGYEEWCNFRGSVTAPVATVLDQQSRRSPNA